MNDEIKLNKCHRCGGKVEIFPHSNYGYYVGCKSCDMKTIIFKDKEDLIKSWQSYTESLESTGTN